MSGSHVLVTLQDESLWTHAVAMQEEAPPAGARAGGGGVAATLVVVPLQLPKQSGARYVVLAQVLLGGLQSEHLRSALQKK